MRETSEEKPKYLLNLLHNHGLIFTPSRLDQAHTAELQEFHENLASFVRVVGAEAEEDANVCSRLEDAADMAPGQIFTVHIYVYIYIYWDLLNSFFQRYDCIFTFFVKQEL